MTWNMEPFARLSAHTLYGILQARCAVFVAEQDCPYQDMDGSDLACLHLWAEEDGQIAAYCRIAPPGVKYAEASVGRVITTAPFRGTGLGRELMRRAMAYAFDTMAWPALRISAQARLRRFYEELGFAAVSETTYLEDNIPHIEMLARRGRGG